ncbi:MAG: hypothetical protein WA154_10110 [Moraxellaceae bacterium]
MLSLFYMWHVRRDDLISQHDFYVAEGKARITEQFSDSQRLEHEAKEKAEQWLSSVYFDPDRDDPADMYEHANDLEIQFYSSLDELGNSFRLALISGMFHRWECAVRDWLTCNDGVLYWSKGTALPQAIWKANFHQIFELFECAGLFPAEDEVKKTLNKCRLVVNTYKHGRGSGLDELRQVYPELLDRYQLGKEYEWFSAEHRSYDDLYVPPSMIDEFSGAIVEFWKAIPEYITEDDFSNFPAWFDRAINKASISVVDNHAKQSGFGMLTSQHKKAVPVDFDPATQMQRNEEI